MIPRDFLDDLLSRTDIVSVIGSHLELKKKGANFSALCPFHNEKTPSFTVNSNKQFYHCFGCGASGDAVKFLMEYCGMTFPEVLNDLAKQHGLTVPNDQKNESVDFREKNLIKKSLKKALVKAARFYQKNLKHEHKAINYLKSRGISGKTALRFHLGVALKGWHGLREVFFEDYDDQTMIDSGLIVKSEAKSSVNYDRFRDRLIFPIFNISGEVIGFGARSFGEEQPKYLNSPETEIFSKGKELFGIFEAKTHISKSKLVIVVEGYMDVIGLFENGVKNSVASLGTSFTKTQFITLSRMAEKIVFMFDGDNAGKKAAHRALVVILPELKSLVSVDFVFLPDGKDPDSYVRSQGLKALNLLVDKAMPMSEFIFYLASNGLSQNIVEGRTKIINNLLEFFKIMHESVLRNQIILEATNRFDFSAEEFELKKHGSSFSSRKKSQLSQKRISREKLISRDIRIFKIFIRFPLLLQELDVLLQEIDDSRYPIFSDIQKNAIIVILDNCSSSQNPQNNLAILKEVILKAEQIDSAVIDLLRKGCEVDLAIDDMPNYDVSSAKADLKYILKRLLIDYLESQASRIIKSGESFDKLSSIRTKISDLTGNKLS
jgi:DNA primase